MVIGDVAEFLKRDVPLAFLMFFTLLQVLLITSSLVQANHMALQGWPVRKTADRLCRLTTRKQPTTNLPGVVFDQLLAEH
jgi:hypothetical protein